MRLLEFHAGDAVHLGVVEENKVFDVAELKPELPQRMLQFIQTGDSAVEQLAMAMQSDKRGPGIDLEPLRLGPPLPNPPKLLCVAANYREHILESGFDAPDLEQFVVPQFFCKFPSTCIIGPDAAIPLTSFNVALDWELELAVVIGRKGKYISEEGALGYVFGYTIINDVSERRMNSNLPNRQLRDNDGYYDWLNGKWFDGSAPMGPVIVTVDELRDPQNLNLRLEVNGEVMQSSSTSKMISSVAQQISHISTYVTLEPGDVIATGTPEGTGISRNRFLKAEDVITCYIDGIGHLQNPVEQAN
jgi:2-keto-4-pentenoate hydratase/2-oxohepta-3-ene-1,7-dioic acid hydratase in catechol pathway